MGCNYYECEGSSIKFSESNDDWRCLCTLSPNNHGVPISLGQLKSLAALGLAVVLLHDNELDGPVFLPGSLPKWALDELDRLIPRGD